MSTRSWGGCYKVIRMYHSGRTRVILCHMSLEGAQAHCSDPMTHGLSHPDRPGYGRCNDHGEKRGVDHDTGEAPGDYCPVCKVFLFHDWFDGYDKN